MSTHTIGIATPPPPTFEQARNRRQRCRAAGMHPNYWYPVEWSRNVPAGTVVECVFWKKSFAVFRGEDGRLSALANRCAHRQLKLSVGKVEGCNVVCPYHGWHHGADGRVSHIPHELFGRDTAKFKVPTYPLRERYGLIWIFPGDPKVADSTPMPEIPELEMAGSTWVPAPVDFTWKAHHSMIIDNVSDFTHAWLHQKFQPFQESKLIRHEVEGDAVHVAYETVVGGGAVYGRLVDHKSTNTNHIDLCYQYPYQWSNTDGRIKHWLFVRPIDERTTRSFFIFYFDTKAFRVPLLGLQMPKWLFERIMPAAHRLLLNPLLAEDGFAVEEEQAGYETHWDAPLAELNPAVHSFQDLTIRKWEEYLESLPERVRRRAHA